MRQRRNIFALPDQGIFSGLILLLFLGIGDLPAQAGQLARFEYTQPKMGTSFRIVLYASSAAVADSAAAAAFRRIDELNLIFSDYREDSEVSRLSATAGSGQKVAVSAELWEVLRFAHRLSIKSKGAFDVTVGPLSKLWRRAFRQQEFPGMTKIAEARAQVGYRYIRYFPDKRAVRLLKTGMHLDFGGIAKGYTVDAVCEVLRQHGIHQAVVDGGGDLYAGDPPPGSSGWEIGFLTEQDGKLPLARRAIASSGSTYKYLEWNGRRYSHIIDPRTGFGVTETAIVNVAAPDCMQADAFASTLSVLNSKESFKLLRSFPQIQWINSAGQPISSPR